ncbi:MAG: PAS domain-containing sensor histidine kinase, partial [Limisphaerales bacterium]
DGEWRQLSMHGVPVRDFGEIRRWVGFCRDITDAINYVDLLIQERDFATEVMDRLPGFFLMTDESGKIVRWNRQLETVFGYSPEEMTQILPKDLIDPAHRTRMAAARKSVLETGEPHEAETYLFTKAGKRIPFLIDGTRVSYGGKTCVAAVGVDISDLKEAERELREVNVILEDRVRERTAQLEQNNKELEAFSYTVSHDLQAPLRAIRGLAQALEEDYADQLEGEGREWLQTIRQSGQRMSQLIEDILRYSTSARTRVKLQPFSVIELLQQIRNEFDLRLQEIGGELEVPAYLPAVEGDKTLLTQIFSNLFQNSINYRRKDVPLRLKVDGRREGDTVLFSISDNGVGIGPEHYETVFQPFRRLHSQKECPGTGLGLATVRKAVETMGGKVWIESEVGRGSTFFVQLKAATPTQTK